MTYTEEEKLEAIRRELKLRRRVYPRRIADKRMTQQLAERQIAIFEQIEADYVERASKERLI